MILVYIVKYKIKNTYSSHYSYIKKKILKRNVVQLVAVVLNGFIVVFWTSVIPFIIS